MSDQILVRPRGNPAWRPGVSGNPSGRPRSGTSLADVLRAKCSAEWIADRLRELASSAESEQVRLSALQQISDRTHGKVTDRLELSRGTDPEDDDGVDYSALDLDQLRALEAAEEEYEQQRARILASAGRLALPPGAEPGDSGDGGAE